MVHFTSAAHSDILVVAHLHVYLERPCLPASCSTSGDAYLGCLRLMGQQCFLGVQMASTEVDSQIALPKYHCHGAATLPAV